MGKSRKAGKSKKKILSVLDKVVEDAQKKIDIETANNPNLKKAISIVEQFLRSSGRVCYGGQAINSYLPKKDQFYDPERNLPDYDFFTPNQKQDAKELIELFRLAGYTEISKRVGIHEGTTKLYVNFYPIADITEIDSEFYLHIRRKANVINGIHYTDPLFLRMMMFLELSRPMGMISRWKKVWERLDLLDKAQPLTTCTYTRPSFLKDHAMTKVHPMIMKYILTNKRVYLGANIFAIYTKSRQSMEVKAKKLFNEIGPVIFMSHDADMDATNLKNMIDFIGPIQVKEITGYQSILPAMIGIYHENIMLALIVQEEACHSYFNIPVSTHVLRVASLDTFLAFLIGLYYREDDSILPINSLPCWIQIFNDLSHYYRKHPTKHIKPFSGECSGYQTSFASLLRAKGVRIEAARQKMSEQLSKGVNSRILSKTRSRIKIRSKTKTRSRTRSKSKVDSV